MKNKRMYKKYCWIGVIAFVLLLLDAALIQAQETGDSLDSINYSNGIVLDTDMDGLTDEGEAKTYRTDQNNPDTDQDGFFDGAEVLGGSDPLDPNSPSTASENSSSEDTSVEAAAEAESTSDSDLENVAVEIAPQETPWAWYTVRAGGLIGIALLYISIVLGLVIRIPFLQRFFRPIIQSKAHCWISLQALLFAFLHGAALLFDKFFSFSVVDIFVPFAFKSPSVTIDENLVALGIIGFYLMLLLVVTSYSRKHVSQGLWRATHFANIALYAFVTVHALYLGTDLKSGAIREVFIILNEVLIGLMLFNMIIRIRTALKLRRHKNNVPDNFLQNPPSIPGKIV